MSALLFAFGRLASLSQTTLRFLILLFFWGGSDETISLMTATSNSNCISSAAQMKAFLILCQVSQDLQKQAHSFPFYFLASQELCVSSLLLEEQLCCAEDTPRDRKKTSVVIRQRGDKHEPQRRAEASHDDRQSEGQRPRVPVPSVHTPVLSF